MMTAPLPHFDLSRQDRERYLCALSAPYPAHAPLLAILAFNQELAHACRGVSDPMLGHIKLQWWIDALPGILQGRPPAHPVAEALAAGVGGRQGCEEQLISLAQARTFDLETDRPASLDDVQDYAYATGGALQALMVDILGVHDAPTRQAARDVGAAWALIGLMRALPHRDGPVHGHGSRDMLPQDATVRAVLERAAQLLALARRRSVVRAALPALVVARLADRHLARLERQNRDPAQRHEPPAGAGAVVSIWMGKLTGRF